MKKPNQETVRKIAVFMKDIHDKLQNGSKFTLKDITHKHHISTRVGTAMAELKIIDRIRKGRGGVKYFWSVGEPNLKMAENVCRVANERKKKEVKKSNNPVKEFVKEFANRESEESFNKRKELAEPVIKPIIDDIMNDFFFTKIIREIITDEVQKALTPPVKIRKVLKWRNPFYWVIK